jgi:hypothetical protein
MKHILLVYSVVMFFIPAYPAFSQYGDAGPGQEEAMPEEGEQSPSASVPVVIPEQPYEYYYWPEEDLDNFGLSTLGQGQGGSTLGRGLQRKSNIEVNSPKEPPQAVEDAEGKSGDEGGDTGLFPPEETGDDGTAVNEAPPAGPKKESEFYEWVDEKGNVHITNNIGDVPPEYQKEIYERKLAPESE